MISEEWGAGEAVRGCGRRSAAGQAGYTGETPEKESWGAVRFELKRKREMLCEPGNVFAIDQSVALLILQFLKYPTYSEV